MDTTLAGLLQSCAERPYESTSHLILADWLEDHDQPERAELVRLQCRLADWVPNWEERRALLEQQATLIATHQARWLGPLVESCQTIEFHRGLARVTVRGRTFAAARFQVHLESMANTALIEQVRFQQGLYLTRLCNAASLELIPSLSFEKVQLGDELATALVRSPRLTHLVSLNLANNAIEDAGAEALTNSDLFSRLSWLDLRNNQIGAPEVQNLLHAASSRKDPLAIDVMGNVLTPGLIDQIRTQQRPGLFMNSLGMEFVRIPAGTFLRGSPDSDHAARSNEKPQHCVTLTQPFWLGRFAVTQGQYQTVRRSNPSEFGGDPRRPVDSVTWEHAMTFCERLGNRVNERKAGHRYRLPTEAEWEHACRAGGFSPFHFGDPPSADLVNYDGRYNYGGAPPGPYVRRTSEVGAYPANAFGLFDMHGNVWEWCSDRYSETSYSAVPVTNPQGIENGTEHVRRGGCWDAIGSYCRSAHRNGQPPTQTNRFTGFRVVLVKE